MLSEQSWAGLTAGHISGSYRSTCSHSQSMHTATTQQILIRRCQFLFLVFNATKQVGSFLLLPAPVSIRSTGCRFSCSIANANDHKQGFADIKYPNTFETQDGVQNRMMFNYRFRVIIPMVYPGRHGDQCHLLGLSRSRPAIRLGSEVGCILCRCFQLVVSLQSGQAIRYCPLTVVVLIYGILSL